MTTYERSIFEREKRKSKPTSDLQSTITFWVVPYTFASVAIGDSLLTLLFTLFSDKHTTNLIEAVAVYTNKIQKLKTLIKLSNLCNSCGSSQAMLKDVSAIKNCEIAGWQKC